MWKTKHINDWPKEQKYYKYEEISWKKSLNKKRNTQYLQIRDKIEKEDQVEEISRENRRKDYKRINCEKQLNQTEWPGYN